MQCVLDHDGGRHHRDFVASPTAFLNSRIYAGPISYPRSCVTAVLLCGKCDFSILLLFLLPVLHRESDWIDQIGMLPHALRRMRGYYCALE